ncbi:MAG: glycosyltransferase family 4 protein [Kineosporiaceae bacterium]|nr:glycosyltransferase family 4 protein [Aeromicrobium sp.]
MTVDQAEEPREPHLWLINHYAATPLDGAGGLRHHFLASRLGELGWTTTIIAATTVHSSREQRAASTLRRGRFGNVSWHWIKSPNYTSGGLSRLVNMLVFTARLLVPRTTRSLSSPSMVLGSTVHPLAAWAALRLARRHRVPFIFEVRDLWPETLIDMGALARDGLPARLLRRLERHLYRNAELIITTMPEAHTYITTFGVDREKIVWISNGTDVDSYKLTPPPMNVPFRFLYCGTHGTANDLEQIILGFHNAQNASGPGAMFLELVGNGPSKPALIELVDSLGLHESVLFSDAVLKSELPQMMEKADAVVLSMLPLKLYRFGISMNKLFDYLASARPVLLTGNPVNNVVRDANAGVWRRTNSASDISDGMTEMFESSYQDRAMWGANGFAVVKEEFSYEHLGKQLDLRLRPLLLNPR